MEEQVKRLIRKSLHMRLQGMGRIDNIRTNEALIETWITAIVALGYADNDVEIAAKDHYCPVKAGKSVFEIVET